MNSELSFQKTTKKKEIRKKLYEEEKIDEYFKELEENEEKKGKKISRRTRKKISRRTREETIFKRIRKKEYFKKNSKSFGNVKENLNILKKYCDNDDPDYERIRSIENLFNNIDGDYYKPVKLKAL